MTAEASTREVLGALAMRLLPLAEHPDLPTTHLRLAQVLATAWLVTGQSFVWPAPWLSPLEGLPALPWRLGLALLSTGLCLALLATRFTRACAAGLAGLIALELVAAPTWVAHNRLFVLALLVMVALSTKRLQLLPRLQVGVVFALATVDKLLAPAWRDGRFASSFLEQLATFGLMWSPGGRVGAENPLASWLSAHVGSGVAAGWLVIALEAGIAAAFLANWRPGAWLNALFHCAVFGLTGSTMGQFFFAGSGSSLLLVPPARLPSASLVIGVTALLAGPWTHRALPLVVLLSAAVAWWRAGRRRATPASPGTG